VDLGLGRLVALGEDSFAAALRVLLAAAVRNVLAGRAEVDRLPVLEALDAAALEVALEDVPVRTKIIFINGAWKEKILF
jgi:hypothetical protein